jgi:hypothetical protein
VEALGEVHDGVYPVTETPYTLHPVKHHAIAEDQLVRLRVGPWEENIIGMINFFGWGIHVCYSKYICTLLAVGAITPVISIMYVLYNHSNTASNVKTTKPWL